jgi:excisionase family DNA binding protein
MGKDELLTTQQAAERLGLTDSRVRQLVLEGRLPAQKFGHLNMIRVQDLALVADINVSSNVSRNNKGHSAVTVNPRN